MDAPTDVLSFPVFHGPQEFPSRGPFLLGDIVLCPQVAQRRAGKMGLRRYLRWLLVHGLLHLLGYEHQGPGEAAAMRRKEEELLRALEAMD